MELGRWQIQNLKVKSKKWKLKKRAFSYKKMFVVYGSFVVWRLAFGVGCMTVPD
jgi:hypothetical protein